jgi:predicted double-glycine peptidase
MTRVVISLLVALLGSGCLYRGDAEAFDASEHRHDVTLLEGVPVVRQEGHFDCGPAALSSLLAYWGIRETPDSIRRATKTPPNQTMRAGDLRDYVQRRGLDAFVFRGSFADLEAEIEGRRPVLVGTLKPYVGDRWLAHYEVVTGVGPTAIITMDPAAGYREYSRAGFLREWERTNRVMLVAAKAAAPHASNNFSSLEALAGTSVLYVFEADVASSLVSPWPVASGGGDPDFCCHTGG